MADVYLLKSEPQSTDVRLNTAVINAFEKGQLFIFPTDTIYGLGCDAFNANAIQRVRDLKSRQPNHPFSIHLGDISEVKKYVAVEDNRQSKLIEELLPGPYTLILRASRNSPPECISIEGKVGIRVPESAVYKRFYSIANRPLIGTSVNQSGREPLQTPDEIERKYAQSVELIICTNAAMSGESSSVIDITISPPKVIRGSLPPDLRL